MIIYANYFESIFYKHIKKSIDIGCLVLLNEEKLNNFQCVDHWGKIDSKGRVDLEFSDRDWKDSHLIGQKQNKLFMFLFASLYTSSSGYSFSIFTSFPLLPI